MKFISTILLLVILAISAISASPVKGSGIECELCQFVAKTAEDYLSNNSTVAEVETELQLACKILPSEFSTACDSFVNTYAPLIINLLVNKENPDTLCTQIKLCTSNARRQNKKMIKVVPQQQSEDSSSLYCSICGYVVTRIEAYVAANNTESQIVSILDTDCKVLKANTWVTACQTIVNQYTPTIINYLENKEPPKTICSQIGICPSGSGSGEEEEIPAPKFDAGLDCPICTFVVSYAQKFVASNKSESEIIAVLQKECSVFGSKYSADCVAMVNNYIPEIITYLENNYTPAQVCQEIGLCSSSKKSLRPSLPNVNGGDLECVFCDYILQYAVSLLSNNQTDQQVLQTLINDCSLFGNQDWINTCSSLVTNYGEKIINFILTNPNPQNACAALGLCGGSSSDSTEAQPQRASIFFNF
eukprot:gene5660-7046_t